MSSDDHIGRLEGDEFEEEAEKDPNNTHTGSKAILIYFSRLASTRSTEKIDYDFVYHLIRKGSYCYIEFQISSFLNLKFIHEILFLVPLIKDDAKKSVTSRRGRGGLKTAMFMKNNELVTLLKGM